MKKSHKKGTSLYIKSPLNYIGGKGKLLSQILPLFPQNISTFVDLFAGGCNVAINVKANSYICNDNIIYLIDMYRAFQEYGQEYVLAYIYRRIEEFNLSKTNSDGYKKLRDTYNVQRNPLDLFVLIAFSFNHQIRFNSRHEFNNPFGRERSAFNPSMQKNLGQFIEKIQQDHFLFSSVCFSQFDFSSLGENDFIYLDPPYLITTAIYNDGKRGFRGWTEKEEMELLELLDILHKKRIKFALSNVIEHKGKSNTLLQSWLSQRPEMHLHMMDFHYSNSSYQTLIRDTNATKEVLITNYIPPYNS